MLGDSINMNNFCCNPVVLKKKIGKTSKKLLFWAQFTQKEVIIGHILNEKQFFFSDITKSDHQVSETFYLIKVLYVLAEL